MNGVERATGIRNVVSANSDEISYSVVSESVVKGEPADQRTIYFEAKDVKKVGNGSYAKVTAEQAARQYLKTLGFTSKEIQALAEKGTVGKLEKFFSGVGVIKSGDASGKYLMHVAMRKSDVEKLQSVREEMRTAKDQVVRVESSAPRYDYHAEMRKYELNRKMDRIEVERAAKNIAQTVTQDSSEGVGSFLNGVLLGDLDGVNQTWSKTAGQVLAGAIPIYGQVADVRDTLAAVKDVYEGKDGALISLAASGIGFIPVAGDAIKAGMRVGKQVVGKESEEITKRALKGEIEEVGRYASDVTEVANRVDEGSYLQVNTGGLRNEELLTEAQKAEARDYANLLGMPESQIIFSDYANTAYGDTFDILRIGTDLLPSDKAKLGTMYANSRVGWKGTLAHELEGHRAAALAGKAQEDLLLEEVQASIRAARFAPGLTSTERYTLLRDAIARLRKAGISIKDVKDRLWIELGRR